MTDMSGHDWRELAEAARVEEDPDKLMELIQELNRALDEHTKNQFPRSTEATG